MLEAWTVADAAARSRSIYCSLVSVTYLLTDNVTIYEVALSGLNGSTELRHPQ